MEHPLKMDDSDYADGLGGTLVTWTEMTKLLFSK